MTPNTSIRGNFLNKEKFIVDKLVKKYNSYNPFEICEKMNINLIYADLGEIRGYYRYSKQNKFITINSILPDHEKLNVCAHELGHAVLHSEYNRIFLNSTFFLPSKFENQANRFAAYLILKGYADDIENITVTDISKITGIPLEYLMLIL